MAADSIEATLRVAASVTSDEGPPFIDFTGYSDHDLNILLARIRTEQLHRSALANAPAQISAINSLCMAAQGVVQGTLWVQPTDATNAYPQGWVVSYEGDEWESLIPANTHAPGDPSDPQAYRWWKNLTTVPAPGAWAAGVAYKVGDVVTYNGQSYKCLQAHTSQPDWTPPVVPALWQLQAS